MQGKTERQSEGQAKGRTYMQRETHMMIVLPEGRCLDKRVPNRRFRLLHKQEFCTTILFEKHKAWLKKIVFKLLKPSLHVCVHVN